MMRSGLFDARHMRTPATPLCVAVVLAILCAQALALLAMGHPLICECGYVALWHGAASGPQTSQHLTDWYSFTHVEHGLLFYALITLLLAGAPFRTVVLIAFGVEAVWELVENTPLIMDRYRQTALAAGYFGDSVVNSIGDTLSMALGLAIARIAPVRVSLVLVVAMECLLLFAIRDNLTLNIIQLIYPLEAINQWQAGG
ncbi:hypothetical protein SSPSH_002991 [Salinisphaera shabanensis E1L3A]|uniref:Uncharacterized protein n=2 Tax=Salinisphaera shabanensis TaxID=180542 RepID=U2FPZ2_9GAMM|nr:hypothetical protein SSPSH_002991 [Salinisphaera shabanensis E1L3A]